MSKVFRCIISLLLIVVCLSLSSCGKDDKTVNVKTMHTITFMVDNTQFGKSYIVEGEQGKAINGPVLEGRKFLYWGIDGKEFDFNTPIMENIILNAYFEEAATVVITDHIDMNNLTYEKVIIHNDVIKASIVKGSLIKPGSDGSCYFYLSNSTPHDISFTVSLSESKNLDIYLQYNFRTIISSDSTRIWKDVSELKDITITIPATSRVLFSLDWVWQHADGSINELYINDSSNYVDVTFTFQNFTKAE